MTIDKKEITEAEAESWENGSLGRSEEHAKKGRGLTPEDLENALGLKSISIRLDENLIQDLKAIARMNGTKYQPLIRQILHRWTEGEKKKISIDHRRRMRILSDESQCDEIEENQSADDQSVA